MIILNHMSYELQPTTTIRIRREAHDKLREMSYVQRRSISDIINVFAGVKERSHHRVGEVDKRKKHVRTRPLTMVEQLLKQKK